MDTVLSPIVPLPKPRLRDWFASLFARWGTFLDRHGAVSFPSGGCCLVVALALMPLSPAIAAEPPPLRIGVLTDTKVIGLASAQGLVLTTAYYSDRDEASLGFAR